MNKLRILRWGDDPGLSGWVQCNLRVLLREKEEGQNQGHRDVTREAEAGMLQSHEPRSVGCH